MKDKVIQLLSLTYLNEQALPHIISGYVFATGSEDSDLVERVLAYTNSTLFLDLVSQNFFKIFTEQEVDQLVEFYDSDVVKKIHENSDLWFEFYDSDVSKKFNDNSKSLSDCVYLEIARFIKDEIAYGK